MKKFENDVTKTLDAQEKRIKELEEACQELLIMIPRFDTKKYSPDYREAVSLALALLRKGK